MTHSEPKTILRIDSSLRRPDSVTRGLADELIDRLLQHHPQAQVRVRDLADGLPLIDPEWVQASFTEAGQRGDEQRQRLALSETLLEELESSDILVLGVPIYNFSIPAVLKAWVDLVTRARRSFRYTDKGPEGLLRDRPTYMLMASGGTPIGGEMDFASGYMRHVLGFIGIHDLHLLAADQMNLDAGQSLRQARRQMNQLMPDLQAA